MRREREGEEGERLIPRNAIDGLDRRKRSRDKVALVFMTRGNLLGGP